MNKCVICGKEYESSRTTSKYCSVKCKQSGYRNKQGKVSVTNVTVTDDKVTVTRDAKYRLTESKVYGRHAVVYENFPEAWDLRPEPLDPSDVPVKFNRCRYTRPDGSQYIFDSCGKVFELTDGKVYKTIADLREAQGAII